MSLETSLKAIADAINNLAEAVKSITQPVVSISHPDSFEVTVEDKKEKPSPKGKPKEKPPATAPETPKEDPKPEAPAAAPTPVDDKVVEVTLQDLLMIGSKIVEMGAENQKELFELVNGPKYNAVNLKKLEPEHFPAMLADMEKMLGKTLAEVKGE